ncbi:MAG TPA: phosphate ABC transporter permease PstA [Acidimicrobiales bacterium]|jgi:phosphate transport system permease protein|nr:phosphate ABC transporter permease PstA [Acidimicrobiales bacterium]
MSVVAQASPGPVLVPRRPRQFGWDSAGLLAGSVLSGTCLVWVVFYQLTLLSGAAGFVVCSYVASLAIYWSVTALVEGRLAAKDRVIAAVMWSTTVGIFCALALVIGFVVVKGARYMSLHYFTQDAAGIGPSQAASGRGGGLHAIVGTLEQNALCVAMGAPVAVMTAVFLNEIDSRLTWMVRTVVTAMSGIPSIVAGIFVFSVWSLRWHHGHSGFAGALALAVLILPTITRTTEEVLRLVPGGLREAALALGAPEWRTVWSVVLPTARAGVITAVVLGAALTVGETAPLIFTSFSSSVTNVNPFSGPQAALPLTTFTLVNQPVAAYQALAYTTALVLLVVVGILFALTRVLGSRRPASGGARRRRREGA